ncbi:ectonucleoside triphosphate diphosphohydrolase 5-like [Uloborus diversus]|uniref:ectonucleoside triphosphate diphosphohydrolase 5-like n=1 Tax=Uloborus diversus TaxID=327109 RepID=UPI00240A0C43|nr:ectonucleoside triphosphate diphosphohydrolase 5-like [Uloborus diversus]XP_054711778.1 ectonucleoside triphosphate diphosphohydrolase 5-like [Uloborus diversus]XP_054711779.1 ectonucleoside triphosphate diphosphohydrolase 5-like [Uloborus diversus]XP_054711780.1 ectonucleoside triphosphate diphosphohydrolase 5-like [Uloborus diversus]
MKIEMDGGLKIKWTLYITLIVLFIFVCVSEVGPLTSLKIPILSSHEEPSSKYVIVFDGGSTATRLHVFCFANSSSGHLSLKREHFEEFKPGLSNFANEPEKAAISVYQLLEKAKQYVPPDSWDETPISLKATAGLRLLPSQLSDAILEEVSKTIKQSPFVSNENSVSVLDEEDEGLFAWYTLNFLLGRLTDPSRSVASMDLGGGSIQVTFTPVDLDTLVFSPKSYVVSRKIQNKTLSIYSHSYLGLGLMAARLAILQLSNEKTDDPPNGKDVSFQSPCIYPSKKSHVWNYDQKEFALRGRKDGKYGFKYCYEKAVEFLGDTVDQPEELMKRDIYALSYFYDRSYDMQLFGKMGGIISVGEFMNACKNVCEEKIKDQPLLCLDCSYISALLHHGLGLDKKKELLMGKRINGIETSWGLGAAFNMIL